MTSPTTTIFIICYDIFFSLVTSEFNRTSILLGDRALTVTLS